MRPSNAVRTVWDAEAIDTSHLRLPANPENCYHPRQFGVHLGNPEFRTIQVWPKDLAVAARQAERAADRPYARQLRWSVTRSAHATSRIHHPAWKRRDCVAAHGARAAAD